MNQIRSGIQWRRTDHLQKGSEKPFDRTAVRLRACLTSTSSSPPRTSVDDAAELDARLPPPPVPVDTTWRRAFNCSEVTYLRHRFRSPLYVSIDSGLCTVCINRYIHTQHQRCLYMTARWRSFYLSITILAYTCVYDLYFVCFFVFVLVAWRSGNAFRPINKVTLRQAGLVCLLWWVTACRKVNHLA